MALGPALPVGTAGEREYLDLFLSTYVPAEAALSRLARATPDGLAPQAAAYVADGGSSLSAMLTVARYDVAVECPAMGPDEVRASLEEVVGAGELHVEHKGKHKVFDLATCLLEKPQVSSHEALVVHVATRIGQDGSLRPESLVSAALSSNVFSLAVTRTDLFAEVGGELVRPLE